jgi:hypothetical protein
MYTQLTKKLDRKEDKPIQRFANATEKTDKSESHAMIDDDDELLNMIDDDDDFETMQEDSSDHTQTLASSTHPNHNKKHFKKKRHKKNSAERIFERKYLRYKEDNHADLKGLQEWEKFEKFRNSNDIFGKRRGDKKWFLEYVNITTKSGSTWWTINTKQSTRIIDLSSNDDRGSGSMDKTVDIGVSSGKMTITYDMYTIPDKIKITDAITGNIIYESRKVQKKDGSGSIKKFNLGEGNRSIRIQINPDKPDPSSNFEYKIIIESSEKGTSNAIVNSIPDTKGEHKKYNK